MLELIFLSLSITVGTVVIDWVFVDDWVSISFSASSFSFLELEIESGSVTDVWSINDEKDEIDDACCDDIWC